MLDRAQRFRDRARNCLNIAKGTKHEADRIILEDMAADLVTEAKRIEALEAEKSAQQ